MTIKEIIRRVDEKCENAFSEREKVEWVAALDGKIALTVMLMGPEEARVFDYRYPECLEHEPLISFPFDHIYDYWLEAMIDYGNGEMDKYSNAMQMYNAELLDYKKWFINLYDPAQGCRR